MALVLKDRVKETTSTAGTGTVTLDGAVAGFQSFSAVGNGNATYYAIVDSASGDWEVGIGTYTSSGTTLSRTTVLSSSNSGSLVNFAANPKDVFVTYPSEKSVYEDASNVVNATSFGAITATSAALTTGTVSTTPASNTDIANKQYVDGLVTQGISYHEPVYVESPNTTGNLNATYNNGASGVGATLTNAGTQVALTVDGILMTVGKRVLIYNQTNATQNGVYEVTTVGDGSTNWVLTRTSDADTYGLRDPNALGYNDAFFVTNGNTGAGETYVCTTTGTITFGTTNITFAQISSAQVYTAGTGLNLSPATTFNISNTGVSASTYGSASAVPVFAVNAQGQITGVTNTNIAISGSAVSGNISGSAGSVANALTLGTYLTGSSFNGSSAVTATVDATSANTASKVVARDASGNFSAGTITATLSGAATSATTATNLASGAANQIPYQTSAGTTSFAVAPTVTGSVLSWNGSAFAYTTNIATATSATSATSATTATNLAGGGAGQLPYNTGSGATSFLAAGTAGYVLQSNGTSAPSWVAATAAANNGSLTLAVSGTGLSGSATFTANQATSSTFTVTSNATSANTASTIVARDASGNFTAGTVTAALSGNATTATTATQVANALTAGTYLTSAGTFTGAAARTFAVDATTTNTASKVVARDASGNFSAGTITAALSGNATTATTATNLAGGATGSIAYQSAAGTTTFLADVATGNAVISGGVGVAPSYGKIGLTTHVSGTLPVANGGTGVTTSTGSGNSVRSTSPTLVTPVLGTPSSGTLSNCTVDGTNKVGYLNIPQNAQTGSYTLVLGDAGKHIYHASGAGAATYTIPANSSVAYTIGTAVSFINLSTTAISIAITTDTMYLSSAGTTGTRSLAQYGTATAVKITSTAWIITGSGLT